MTDLLVVGLNLCFSLHFFKTSSIRTLPEREQCKGPSRTVNETSQVITSLPCLRQRRFSVMVAVRCRLPPRLQALPVPLQKQLDVKRVQQTRDGGGDSTIKYNFSVPMGKFIW